MPQPGPPSARPVVPLGVTLQRAAADATAEARYDVALELYRYLAHTEPNDPAFVQLCRVLEQRVLDSKAAAPHGSFPPTGS